MIKRLYFYSVTFFYALINKMMDRNEFFKTSGMLSVASIFPAEGLFATNLIDNRIDKLVDENGHFVLQPLPYSESFLEPYMDAETVHLHYTFHHGGATKN
jgi:Fe-Mn family superoxide dismutase